MSEALSPCRRLQRHLVALLGDAARCLGGDVLGDGHGGHGLQRRRVRSGEAAAHALVDGTIPGEAAVLRQRALLTAHWGESIQSLNSEVTEHSGDQRRDRPKLVVQLSFFFKESAGKSYCLIWESWGKSQLHAEGKTREEETLQSMSPSPSPSPIRDKRQGIKACFITATGGQKKHYHLVERRFSLHFPSAGHLFFFFLVFCLPAGPFIAMSCRPVTTFRAKPTDVIAVHADFPPRDLSLYAANNNKSGGKSISISSRPD